MEPTLVNILTKKPVIVYVSIYCIFLVPLLPFLYYAHVNREFTLVILVALGFIIYTLISYAFLTVITSLNSYHQREQIYMDSVGDGIFAIDTDYKIILWNEAASSITRWKKEEVLGQDFRKIIRFVYEKDKTPNISFIEEALVKGITKHMEGDTVLIAKDTTEIPVSDSASPIRNQAGEVLGIIVVFQDITHQREVEKAREESASLASHQLRTPATAIRGYSRLLLDGTVGVLSEKQKQCAEEIYTASRILLNLINALLNVSRIEIGTLAISPVPTQITHISDSVINEVKPRIDDKHLEFSKSYDPELPLINLDPDITHIILQNLITNAIKYTPDGGKINISIKKLDTKALITVKDSGYGIPTNQQNKIFAKLFRADNIIQKEAEGTGLGLYMVKKVVDEFNGKIWFESEENKGTSFYVTIPLIGMKRKEGLRGLS